MSEIMHPGQVAQAAMKTAGFYMSEIGEGDPLVPNFVIDINDAHGVALLRRLLTIDVRNLHTGETKCAYVLNALGYVMDNAFVSHLSDADDHYRVAFHTAETLAWIHQVAKAFDAEFETVNVQTVRLWGPKAHTLGVAANRAGTVTVGEEAFFAMHTGASVLLQAESVNKDALIAADMVELDWVSANTMSIFADETNAIDWMIKEQSIADLGRAESLDLSDAYRVFIGRALTEAMVKRAAAAQNVIVTCEHKDALGFFADPAAISLYTREGVEVMQTARVGLVGDKLCARIRIPTELDPKSLLWVDAETGHEAGYPVSQLSFME